MGVGKDGSSADGCSTLWSHRHSALGPPPEAHLEPGGRGARMLAFSSPWAWVSCVSSHLSIPRRPTPNAGATSFGKVTKVPSLEGQSHRFALVYRPSLFPPAWRE